MKNLYHILSYSLIICLIISVCQNYFLWTELRNQEDNIDIASDYLMKSNDLLAEKIYNQHKFSKNTARLEFFEPGFEKVEKLRGKYQTEDIEKLNGIERYDAEELRQELLEQKHFKSKIKYLLPRRIIPKLSSQDSLYVGYTRNLFQDSKYELKVNGKLHEFTLGNRFSFPKDSTYNLELKKITISDDGQSIDTITANRILNNKV